jgi:UDP-glucose 4-epimerase
VKALVTGGAGFIGSRVVHRLLERGYEVTILDNLSSGYRENLNASAQFMDSDVRDPHAVLRAASGKDVIFHLAASVGNRRAIENAHNDASVNVLGTLNVLEAARVARCRKVVYSSSAAIFGEPRQLPIPDDHPTQPMTPYGVSKLAAEKYATTYTALHGVETVCLRYFNVYGELQRFDAYGNVIPIFATRTLRKMPLVVYGDGLQTRDFVNVEDVAQANMRAAEAEGVTGAFNIGTGRAISIIELIAVMADVCGRELSVANEPPRAGDVRHSRADISRATKQLGFVPRCDLREGLASYFDWLSLETERRT